MPYPFQAVIEGRISNSEVAIKEIREIEVIFYIIAMKVMKLTSSINRSVTSINIHQLFLVDKANILMSLINLISMFRCFIT